MTEIPEGYSLYSEKFEEDFQRYYIAYIGEEEELLYLQQTWQEDERPENITSDTEPLKDVEVNGFTGYYAEDGENGSLILSNGIYNLVLCGPLAKEKLIELAGNLILMDED